MTDRVFAGAGDTLTHQVLSFPELLPTLDIAGKALINEPSDVQEVTNLSLHI